MIQDIQRYAYIYKRYKDQYDKIPPEVISELHSYVEREFEKIKNRVRFLPEELNDFEDVKRSHKETGILNVSSLNNDCKLLPAELNLKFRAIHDLVHIQFDFPFDYQGEYDTWLFQARGLSEMVKKVLFSEIVLQTSHKVYFGYFLDTQKVVFEF